MEKAPKRVWKIIGYRSAVPFYERAVPYGNLSEGQARELLSRLAATTLNLDEIVASSFKQGAKSRASHLDVLLMSNGRTGLMTTGNPYFTAHVEDADA